MNTIFVANREQQILLECELKGQVSDGYWENARNNDWVSIIDAKVVVKPVKVGVNFTPSRKYDFAAKDLVDIVGDRMRTFVMMARKFPTLSNNAILVSEWSKSSLEETFWNDPNYGENAKAEYAKIGITTYAELQAVVKSLEGYSIKDLRKDLRAIKEIFATKI